MQKTKSLYQKTKKSLQLSNNGNTNEAIEVLKQVQRELKQLKEKNPQLLIEQLISLEIITYNNLACAYNKKRKFKSSLFNLQLVSSLQNARLKNIDGQSMAPEILNQVATTHSNLCAVYSQMLQHSKAIKQIETAINLLLSNQITQKSDALIVFYYNYASQLQCIRNFQKSEIIINKALSLVNQKKSVNAKQMRPLLDQCLERIRRRIKRRQQRVGDQLKKCIKGYRNSFRIPNAESSISKEKRDNKSSLNHIIFRKNQTLDKQRTRHSKNNKTMNIYQPITTRHQSQNNLYTPRGSQFPTLKIPNYSKRPRLEASSVKKERKNSFIQSARTIEMYSMYQPEKRKRRAKNHFLQQKQLETTNQFSYKNLLEDL